MLKNKLTLEGENIQENIEKRYISICHLLSKVGLWKQNQLYNSNSSVSF